MREQLQGVIEQVGGVLLGKDHQIRQALACLLAGGHLLIEDLPGMGRRSARTRSHAPSA